MKWNCWLSKRSKNYATTRRERACRLKSDKEAVHAASMGLSSAASAAGCTAVSQPAMKVPIGGRFELRRQQQIQHEFWYI